jgi:hypothetical protein
MGFRHVLLSAPASADFTSVSTTVGACAHRLNASLRLALRFVSASARWWSVGTQRKDRQLWRKDRHIDLHPLLLESEWCSNDELRPRGFWRRSPIGTAEVAL